MKVGFWVGGIMSFITTVVLVVYVPLPWCIVLALPAGVFYGLIAAMYDSRNRP